MATTIKTKRMGPGWYRATVDGEEFDVEFCDPREGWSFRGWMWRSVERPQALYSDPHPTKAACLASLAA